MENKKVAFIGAGSMAEALISGMLKEELYSPGQIAVTNRSNLNRLKFLQETYGVMISCDKENIIRESEIVILAMKPKDVEEGTKSIAPFITGSHLVISVLAGVSTASLESCFSEKVPVIRAMPNTSAAVGMSATALSAGKFADERHVMKARSIFETVGIAKTVKESELHAITGLSGSGPAYIYYLIESMEHAAAEIGLEQDMAREFILQTILGAAEMLKTSEKQPSLLRKEVTSPGGTTEAGLKVLEQFHYKKAMVACIKRAAERSEELGKGIS